mmetsp:Transcript_35377/g.92540  ORF Transcript_35377/g.92540 Transcript_35377/m.92540 type:complete len:215 (+) Transcript_35377:1275-1919(+)
MQVAIGRRSLGRQRCNAAHNVQKKVCRVHQVRQLEPQLLKVADGVPSVPFVHERSVGGKQEEAVAASEDLITWLMQHAYNRETLDRRGVLQCMHHPEPCGRVQPRGGLVKDEQRRVAHQLHPNVDALPLPPRDAALPGVSNQRVLHVVQLEQRQRRVHQLNHPAVAPVGRQPQQRLEHQRLPHRQLGVHDVVLRHEAHFAPERPRRLLHLVGED